MNNYNKITNLATALGCRFLENEPMAKHTTFKVGGPCKVMVFPKSAEQVKAFIDTCKAENLRYFILGNGSNILVVDEGFPGVVIALGADFSEVEVTGTKIVAQAGATLAKVCKSALSASLTGLEFAYGIPGTVGGAVYMNAGAYGGEMVGVVTAVTCLAPNGEIICHSAEALEFGYRTSRFKTSGEVVLSVEISLESGDYGEIKAQMDELMSRRVSRQPLEYPSAGSTFKRPQGTFAGLVIEQSGLKGFSQGGAQISEKHANFVINTGNATASDILILISHVKTIVKSQTGYDLECEVEIVK